MLFDRFNKQLHQKHLIVGKETVVDAAIKLVQTKPSSNKDQGTNRAKRQDKTYYGYKGHIAIDEDSQIINHIEFTKASNPKQMLQLLLSSKFSIRTRLNEISLLKKNLCKLKF